MESLGEVDIGGALAALLDARALKRIETGALEGATSDLQRAVTIAPADATAHYNLACAYALSGDADQALVSLGHAVDLDPDQYKSFAMTDPDLASLRARTEFRLMVEPRAPGAVP
jgi:tetratricopeptide (TPR) repeat protein